VWFDGPIRVDHPFFRKALEAPDVELRRWAVGQWANQARAPDESTIRGFLNDEDQGVRLSALGALGRTGDRSIPILVETLDHDDPEVRRRTTWQLAEFGIDAAPAIPRLIELLDSPVESWVAADALIRIGTDSAVVAALPVLLQLLENQDPGLRQSAAHSLSRVDRSLDTVVSSLMRALGDPDADVRSAAASALGPIGRPAAPAVPRLASLSSTDEERVRTEAVQSLVEIGTEEAFEMVMPVLIRRLSATQAWERNNAANLLVRIGPDATDAIPELTKTLRDSNPEARQAAKRALAAIGPLRDSEAGPVP
jgi:hypothetical protein